MILGRDRHIHAACFDEINDAVEALRKEVFRKTSDGREVVFNAHAFPDLMPGLPQGAIIYNTENYGKTAQPQMFFRHRIWEFSKRNMPHYFGLSSAISYISPTAGGWEQGKAYDSVNAIGPIHYVPFGHHPSMEGRIDRTVERDIDVIFAGAMNERRWAVMNALKDRGLRTCVVPHDVYGAERDKLLGRAKLALNMLYYPDGTFPGLRVAHLVANKIPVLSEKCPEGWDFVPTCSYENLVEGACKMLRLDKDGGYGLATKPLVVLAITALDAFRQMPLTLPEN
jgi:hypothetical protein